jgi:hypothetical protein
MRAAREETQRFSLTEIQPTKQNPCMKLRLIIPLVVLFALPLFAQDRFPGTALVGLVNREGQYRIFANFGIEQWEDGKRTTHRFQSWHLSCNPETFGQKLPFDTWCSLERIVIDNDLTTKGTKLVSEHNHYIEEKTLRVTNVDWKAGRLDFDITFTDNNTAQAALRFKRWNDSLFLESFKAIGVTRGLFSDSLAAVEYRIPEYDYVLDVPILMRGLKDQDQKKRDEFESSLSNQDRAAWSKIKGMPFLEPAVMRQYVVDYDRLDKGQRKITVADVRAMERAMRESLAKWVPQIGLSPDGQGKVRGFLTPIIDSMINDMLAETTKP